MKKLWILLFSFLCADVVDEGISEASPEEIQRLEEERIKRGFIPPIEQCSYENEDYWIKIINTCRVKGEYYCPSVMILIDKKEDLISNSSRKATVIATGHLIKRWHPDGNSYVFFDNDNFIYWITGWVSPEASTLRIESEAENKSNKTIYEKELKSCDPNGKIP